MTQLSLLLFFDGETYPIVACVNVKGVGVTREQEKRHDLFLPGAAGLMQGRALPLVAAVQLSRLEMLAHSRKVAVETGRVQLGVTVSGLATREFCRQPA